MTLICPDTFFVFDLDDTLYAERDYHASGVAAVARLVEQAFGRDLRPALDAWQTEGIADLWGALCAELSLPAAAKASFLWAYRVHAPDIALDDATRTVLERVERDSAGLAILTDGRAVSQRLKVKALGLERFPLYVSEEWGVTKPDTRRLIEIQRRHPAARYVTVADNPVKDFRAGNSLGWVTVGLRDRGRNVHPQQLAALDDDFLPQRWIESLAEL